jgi:glycosyltransferase involved in cell wall biosynthesis
LNNNQIRADAKPSGPRILCISPLFPPVVSSEAFCGGKLISALLGAGLDISVLYCSNINGPKNIADHSSLWNSLADVSTDVVIPEEKNRLRSALQAVRYQTYVYVRWINEVVRVATRLHDEQKFDLVYSRSLPTVAHWAGYWCAKKLKLPWIVNFNDPWDVFLFPGRRDTDGMSPYPAMSSAWFRRTLRTADLAVYPSERLHQYHKRIFKLDGPTAIIPHIAAPAPGDMESLELLGAASFRLVHAGKLGTNEKPCRSANALLIGLRDFLKDNPTARSITKLTLVGPEDPTTQSLVESLDLKSNVESIGQVSYEKSLRYINSASICVLVEAGFEEGIFLPSKLVDYIAARKPVLALSPRIGVVADLAARGGIDRVDPGVAEGVRAALSSLYSDFQRGTLPLRGPSEDLTRSFSAQNVVDGFFQALDRVLDHKKAHSHSGSLGEFAT